MIGWIANAFVVAGWWFMAGKNRHALLLGVVGSMLWAVEGVRLDSPALIVIDVILAILGLRAWAAWRE